MEIKLLKKGPITKADLQAYAKASGDHNPIHLDDAFAKEAGFPSVIVHGMLVMAYLGDFLSMNFPQDKFQIQKYRCRFRKVTFPGETLTCKGILKSSQDVRILIVSLTAESDSGEIKADGEAVIQRLS